MNVLLSPKMSEKLLQHSTKSCNKHEYDCCCFRWRVFSNKIKRRKSLVPKDVPKGHTVVYVGENMRRFVVKIGLLNHGLFAKLLELVRDKYDESPTPLKLWIPCHESIFLDVVRQAATTASQAQTFSSCSCSNAIYRLGKMLNRMFL